MNQADLLEQDAASRARALALQSFIVEAPAGAGKTELLTQRYLKLLSVVSEPEEIIAITFTNKAAAEMRSRILDSLQAAADGRLPELPHKRITFDLAQQALLHAQERQWQLLAQPARLRITTIDALSSTLARQMPVMSRFGSQPGMAEDAEAHYREAARRALAMLEDEAADGPVSTALRHLDNNSTRLLDLLSAMLAKRDQWLHHAGQPPSAGEVIADLAALVTQDLARAAALLPEPLQQRLMPLARFAAANLPCEHPLALLLDWDTPLPVSAAALPLWRALAELLLTKDGALRKAGGLNAKLGFPATPEGRAHKEALAELLDALPDAAPLAQVRTLPDPQRLREEWPVVGALAQLLTLAAAHLWAVFQEAGEVDFVEMASRALGALEDDSGPTDLALRLDYRIQHLLVDEFQDTSPAQVRLLERLTAGWQADDGRTLFCVGDPMQSIYRFRKAEVGLFLQVAQDGIGQLALERLQLTRNNRSSPAVVDWVNRAFRQVFPAADEAVRGAIRYRPFAAARAPLAGEGVEVHALLQGPQESSAEAAAREARLVAGLIARERAASPGARIAVLVRARTHLEALVAEIRRSHPQLRFQAVEIEALAARQAVQDVFALTAALLHLADRVHWLAILRAPWCGLTLADLHALAADDTRSTVWELMQDDARVARLSADGRQRIGHVRAVLDESLAQQGRQPLRRWLESAWIRLGGPQCLWEAGDVRDVQAFLALVEAHDDGGSVDIARLAEGMQTLYAAPDAQADGSLQFMTIHKSKGLEFDSVILPGLHRVPRPGEPQLLLWDEIPLASGHTALLAAPMRARGARADDASAYDYLQRLERERSAHEAARVLYVAATRAERRLHLVGFAQEAADGDIKPPANTFLAMLWDSVAGDFRGAAAAGADLPAPPREFRPSLTRLPHPASPALLARAPAAVAAPTPEAERRPPQTLDMSCGTLAHLYMEMIARDGLAHWPASRLAGLVPAMCGWLVQQGHAEPAAAEGAARVAAALRITLGSDAGRWVLQPRAQAAAELAVATREPAGIATRIVDRTFVEAGERWVIDYKSADLGPAADAAAARQHAENYRAQLEGYARLFAQEGRPVRLAVLFLAHGLLAEL